MRHLVAFAGLLAAAALINACGPPPTPVAHAEVCSQADGATVQTEGYFAVNSSVFCSNIGSSEVQCGFEFVESPDAAEGFSADVTEGAGRNQVEPIPEDFSPEAILFHDAEGAEVRIGDKVSITGRLLVAENVCLIDVATFTRVE